MSWSPVSRPAPVSMPSHIDVKCERLEIETNNGAHIQLRLEKNGTIFLAYQDHASGVELSIGTISVEKLGATVRELIANTKKAKRGA